MVGTALTTEAIALTEKKMDMALDDIIKMSRKTSDGKRPPRALNKSRGLPNGHASQVNLKVQQYMESRSSIRQGVLAKRRSNSQGNKFPLTTAVARKAAAVPINNRAVNRNTPRVAAATGQSNARACGFSSVQRITHEGGLSKVQRIAGFDRKQDKVVVTKKRPQTMDALFAGMKEQRMRVISQKQKPRGLVSQSDAPRHRTHQQQQQQQRGRWDRGVGVAGAGSGSGRRFGNFAR